MVDLKKILRLANNWPDYPVISSYLTPVDRLIGWFGRKAMEADRFDSELSEFYKNIGENLDRIFNIEPMQRAIRQVEAAKLARQAKLKMEVRVKDHFARIGRKTQSQEDHDTMENEIKYP